MQIISNDQTVRSKTVQDLKNFNSQPLATQDKKGEQLVSMMPAMEISFELMGYDIVEIFTKKDALKHKLGAYDEKCLAVSKAKLLIQIDDDKRANLIKSRMQNR